MGTLSVSNGGEDECGFIGFDYTIQNFKLVVYCNAWSMITGCTAWNTHRSLKYISPIVVDTALDLLLHVDKYYINTIKITDKKIKNNIKEKLVKKMLDVNSPFVVY